MHQTISIILAFLTISLFIIMMILYRKMKAIRRDCIVNQLRLTQYRYQSDPHTLLNQINSLASFPARIQPSLMQSKILAFGKQIRQALTFSADMTSLINKQVDGVKQLVELENQNSDSPVVLEVAQFTLLAGFEALPSHLLPNLVYGMIRGRNTAMAQLIKIDIKHDGHQLIIIIAADNVESNDYPKGLAGELLKTQLQYFNGDTAKKLDVSNQQSPDNFNGRTITILFK